MRVGALGARGHESRFLPDLARVFAQVATVAGERLDGGVGVDVIPYPVTFCLGVPVFGSEAYRYCEDAGGGGVEDGVAA